MEMNRFRVRVIVEFPCRVTDRNNNKKLNFPVRLTRYVRWCDCHCDDEFDVVVAAKAEAVAATKAEFVVCQTLCCTSSHHAL